MNEHDFYKNITDQMVADMEQIETRCLQRNKVIKIKKQKKANKKLIGIVIAAACAVVIGMPVMAKGLSKLWNTTIAEMFGADEKLQKEYQDTNLTQLFEDSETENDAEERNIITVAENNGVTVTLTQTFTDKYSMYIYVNVKTDGTIPLSGESIFENTALFVDGKEWNGFTSFCGSFIEDKYAASDFERNYQLVYLNSGNEINLANHDVKLELTNLQADARKLDIHNVAEGTWNLAWKVAGEYCGETKTIDLKNTVIEAQSGGTYTLDSIDISPISYNIHYKNQGVDSFEEGSLNITLIMNDENIYDSETAYSNELSLAGNGGGTTIDGEYMAFEKVLDLSKLDAVRINGTIFQIN